MRESFKESWSEVRRGCYLRMEKERKEEMKAIEGSPHTMIYLQIFVLLQSIYLFLK